MHCGEYLQQLILLAATMGSSQNKDPNIIVYISLSKRIYYAGETVEGIVHIDCKAHRPYSQIYIRLLGKEQIHWSETHGKVTYHYRNYRDTYNQEFVLAKFNTGVEIGQYNFPFSLLLPSTLPGSFDCSTLPGSFDFYSSDNYIKYFISAYLPPFDSDSSIQMFQRPLHIREPCRLLQPSFSIRDISNAECCGCCCVCGSAELTLESDLVNLFQNQIFRVRGLVDNTRGTTHINGFKIVLREHLRRISDGGRVNDRNNLFILHQFANEVPVGTSTPFQTELAIPIQVLGYTAIGNIICRAYFLQLVAKVKCCYSDPRVSRHVIVNNSIQPGMQQSQLKQIPIGWNPRVQGPISFLNLKPYYYNPMLFINAINQAGASSKGPVSQGIIYQPSEQKIVY